MLEIADLFKVYFDDKVVNPTVSSSVVVPITNLPKCLLVWFGIAVAVSSDDDEILSTASFLPVSISVSKFSYSRVAIDDDDDMMTVLL